MSREKPSKLNISKLNVKMGGLEMTTTWKPWNLDMIICLEVGDPPHFSRSLVKLMMRYIDSVTVFGYKHVTIFWVHFTC